MADLVSWGLLGAGVLLLLSKRTFVSKLGDKVAGVALVVVGLMMLGVFSLSGIAQSAGAGAISDITLSGGVVNGTGSSDTSADIFSQDDDVVDFYVDDADIHDDMYINVSLLIERTSVSSAESFLLECTSADFTKSGTVYNIVSKNTDSELEGYIDNAGTQRTNGWSKYIAFAEGDVDQSVMLSFKQDEAAEDILTTKEKASVLCTVGDATATINVIAND